MVTLEASLPMMSQIASRTRSCTMRTASEASVSPPEIAPATSPVMRRRRVCLSCRDCCLTDGVATSSGVVVCECRRGCSSVPVEANERWWQPCLRCAQDRLI